MKKFLSIFLSIVLLLCSTGIVAYGEDSADSSTSSTITREEAQAQLEAKRKEVEENLKQSEEKLSQYQDSEKATSEYINSLDEKIGYLNEELSLLEEQVTTSKDAISSLDEEIDALTEDLDSVKESYEKSSIELDKLNDSFETSLNAYCLRLRAMYISGSDSIIVAILTSEDLSQMFSRYEMIKAIAKSDTALLNEVNNKIDDITEKNVEILEEKTRLETDKISIDQKKQEQVNQETTIEDAQKEIAEKKIILAEDRAESDSLLAEYSAESQMYGEYKYVDEELIKKIDDEIDAIVSGAKDPADMEIPEADEIKKNPSVANTTSSVYYKSNAVLNMTYPVPGYYTVSQGYGHYSSGGSHPALDFPLSTGTSVVAAQKGIVLETRELTYSYGKYIIIYHGTDAQGRKIVTLYAHNSKLCVSAGDTVSKGEKIAEGGSTGNSTGPHCHFEIRIDGSQVNPTYYLSK